MSVDNRSTLNLEKGLFPTSKRPRPLRSESPAKTAKLVKDTVQLAVRVDILVRLVNKKPTRDLISSIKEKLGEFPDPFRVAYDQYPLLPIETKSHGGSLLDAEVQSVLCSNAIVESWRQFGLPSCVKSKDSPTENLRQVEAEDRPQSHRYPTCEERLERKDQETGQSAVELRRVGIDHSIALQITSFIWSYSVIFVTGKGECRKVLGPVVIGDSRSLQGTFVIIRFLEAVFRYKVNVWLPGIMERDSFVPLTI